MFRPESSPGSPWRGHQRYPAPTTKGALGWRCAGSQVCAGIESLCATSRKDHSAVPIVLTSTQRTSQNLLRSVGRSQRSGATYMCRRLYASWSRSRSSLGHRSQTAQCDTAFELRGSLWRHGRCLLTLEEDPSVLSTVEWYSGSPRHVGGRANFYLYQLFIRF